MKSYIIVLLVGSPIAVFSANLKNVKMATSAPIEVKNYRGPYVGIGTGLLKLKDTYTLEYFKTTPINLMVGYRFNKYFSLEARYVRDTGKIIYRHGNTINHDYNHFPATFGDYSALAKFEYSFEKFSIYTLLGYGRVYVNKIKGAKRYEDSPQYGVGISYDIASKISIFSDYLHLYSGNGFKGRAQKVNVDAKSLIIGVKYAF